MTIDSGEQNFRKEQGESQDISDAFLHMDSLAFREYLRSLQDLPSLTITIDWVDVPTARKLKAFLDDPQRGEQLRTATIRATEEQRQQELNVFASGVHWEKVE